MKKLIQKITALVCSAAVLLSLSISVTAAEGQKPVYEVDDKDYRAAVDALYNYVPLEELILASLNDLVDSYNNYYYGSKWFYKHVFINAPEVSIDIAPFESKTDTPVPFSASSVFTAEQGRGGSIEEEDGKVRKFNEITVYWNTLLSKKARSEEDINGFLKEKGYDITAVKGDTSGKRFYLNIDENIKKEELYDVIEALSEQFGLLPRTFGYENGTYTLYHDPDYTGYNSEKEYTAKKGGDDIGMIIYYRDHNNKLKNVGTFESGVSFEFDPETRVLVLGGKGVMTYEEGIRVTDTFKAYRPADIVIIGRDVGFETNSEHHERTEGENPSSDDDSVRIITALTRRNNMGTVYIYRGSAAETAYENTLKNSVAALGKREYEYYRIRFIDDGTDPYDVLSGKTVLDPEKDKAAYSAYEKELKEKFGYLTETGTTEAPAEVIPSSSTVGLSGDANLDGRVDLADITMIAKYTLSSSGFPLKNDTAYANADMNGDGKINSIDLSVLIRGQLGKN